METRRAEKAWSSVRSALVVQRGFCRAAKARTWSGDEAGWLSPRIMDIYLQEVEAATFLADQAPEVSTQGAQRCFHFSDYPAKESLCGINPRFLQTFGSGFARATRRRDGERETREEWENAEDFGRPRKAHGLKPCDALRTNFHAQAKRGVRVTEEQS